MEKNQLPDFVKLPQEQTNKINWDKVANFIHIFNLKLLKGETAINTTLDKFPELNDDEFRTVNLKAISQGYIIKKTDDNFNSTTFHIKLNPNT